MIRSTDDGPDVYLETIKRLEPEVHMIDAGAGWASIAISLKRIADALSQKKPITTIDLNDKQQSRLNALLSRMRQCKPGFSYAFDSVELELLLMEISRLRETVMLYRQ